MPDMDLSKLTQKTLKVSRGFTYNYYTAAARGSKPTLMLFHGWPDSARLWAGLINNFLLPSGYGVVAIDCLGYGGTSKPKDGKAYAWNLMAADAVEIIDAENLPTVISTGHDWGAAMCQRLYNFYPKRVSGVILMNVAYIFPSGQFDLDVVNKVTKEAFGAAIYEYWHFFTSDDAAAVSHKNPESLYTAAFGAPESWLDIWTGPGGMRSWVSEGRTQPTQAYATPEHKADFMERLASSEDGFASTFQWYTTFGNVQNEADKLLPEENKTINVPVFYWGGEQDFVCRPALLQGSIDAGYLPNVKSVTREGGHWALLEKPAVFGQDILGWLDATYV